MNTLQLPNGQKFCYLKENLANETNSAITPEDGKQILELVDQLFKKRGLHFFLVFGTLLGAVRDKSVIKGDEDVDIACDDECGLLNSLPYFYENGLMLVRAERGKLYSFRINSRSYIDIYIYRPLKFSIWSIYCCCLYKFTTPKKYFKEMVPINFLGGMYDAPANPENLIAFWYGENWRTPVRGHKFIYEVRSAYYWHQFKAFIVPVIQKIIGWYHWRHFVKKIED